MATRMHTGWDEKRFSRFGDLVAVAVLQTVEDSEMATPGRAKDVLTILRAAFGCPQRCVEVPDDRRPRATPLLLEHLQEITHGDAQSDIDQAKKFILEQTRNVE